MVTLLETKIKGTNKLNVVRLSIYSKLIENGILSEFTNREVDVLANLYLFGGTEDKESLVRFADDCFEKGFTEEQKGKSTYGNSVRNVFSKARKLGVIKRKKVNDWRISKLFLPEYEGTEYIAFKALVSNYAEHQ